jgi:hypothetical protein
VQLNAGAGLPNFRMRTLAKAGNWKGYKRLSAIVWLTSDSSS